MRCLLKPAIFNLLSAESSLVVKVHYLNIFISVNHTYIYRLTLAYLIILSVTLIFCINILRANINLTYYLDIKII